MRKHKVIEIKVQARRQDRRTIVLDDGNVFGISEDVFLSLPLRVGDELTPEEVSNYLETEKTQKIRDAALRLLSYRMRSENELFQRLIRKGFAEDQVTQIITELVAQNYLDDREFAMAFARDKIKSRRIGPITLHSELIQHRLAPSILEETINQAYTEFPVENLLNQLLMKRKVQPNNELNANEKRRLVNFLKRKGFTWDKIDEALRKFHISFK